jgi:hypothetical protein
MDAPNNGAKYEDVDTSTRRWLGLDFSVVMKRRVVRASQS